MKIPVKDIPASRSYSGYLNIQGGKNLLLVMSLLALSACVTQPKQEKPVFYIDGKPSTLQDVALWQQQNNQTAPQSFKVETETDPLNRTALEKAKTSKKNSENATKDPSQKIAVEPLPLAKNAPRNIAPKESGARKATQVRSGPLNLVSVPVNIRKKPLKKPTPKETIVAARTRGELVPAGQNFSGATLVNIYHQDKVDVVYTSPYGLTEIILQAGETVTDTLMMDGDPENWKIDDDKGFGTENGLIRPVIGIKPTLSGLENHISIYTDRRRYRLRIISQDNSYMPAIRWEYPEDKLKLLREKQQRAREEADKNRRTVLNVGRDFNFSYSVKLISGPKPQWHPRSVFDNGQKTYLVFPEGIKNTQAPALFGRNERGDITILNYRPRGNIWEIDHLIQQAELRFGTENQTVVLISREM